VGENRTTTVRLAPAASENEPPPDATENAAGFAPPIPTDDTDRLADPTFDTVTVRSVDVPVNTSPNDTEPGATSTFASAGGGGPEGARMARATTAQSTTPEIWPVTDTEPVVVTLRSSIARPDALPPVPWVYSTRSTNPAPGACDLLRIATAPVTNDPAGTDANGTEYEAESVPPEHPPDTPLVLADATAATGDNRSTPEYSITAIVAFVGAPPNVADTADDADAEVVANTDIPV
jgi:hypothetical protein